MAAGKPESTNSQSGIISTSRSLLVRLNEHEEAASGPPSRALHTTGLPLVPRQRLPEQDLSDVVQEVFKAVSLNINRFRRDRPGDTFRGCLRTISRNKVNDCFR